MPDRYEQIEASRITRRVEAMMRSKVSTGDDFPLFNYELAFKHRNAMRRTPPRPAPEQRVWPRTNSTQSYRVVWPLVAHTSKELGISSLEKAA